MSLLCRALARRPKAHGLIALSSPISMSVINQQFMRNTLSCRYMGGIPKFSARPEYKTQTQSYLCRPILNNRQNRNGDENKHSRFRRLGVGAGGTVAASAVAFAQFDNDDGSGKTREMRMLDASEEDLNMIKKSRPGLLNWVDANIVEPFLTLLRAIHVTLLFTPVLFTMPALLFGWARLSQSWYRYLRFTMEVAGPTFIKLGQWAASRSDIFPLAMCEEFGKLHSNAKQHSMAHTRRIVSGAFNGKPFDECFAEFEEKPLGVGAMGQVYRAKLAPGVINTENRQNAADYVAVKVLHPHIERTVERDLAIMKFLANVINSLPTMEWLSLPGEVDVFATMMRSQLDLRIEAENLRIFGRDFASWQNVSFPKCYPEVSTREVLVEELVEGVSMEKVLKYCKQTPLDRRIATLGLDAFLQMLLLTNFIHSDLHAGNIILTLPDPRHAKLLRALNSAKDQAEWSKVWSEIERQGIQPHICFIDVGLVTELTPRNRDDFVDLFKAIATFDGYKAGELMVQRSRTPETAIDADVFALKTQKLVDQVKRRTFALGSVRLGDLLTSMMDMVRKHHVRMESDFVTVVLSILLLEGIGRQLNPDLDIFKSAIPVLRKVSTQQASKLSITSMSSDDLIQMGKVWMVLEVREFITASINDIYRCVKYDRLSPNH